MSDEPVSVCAIGDTHGHLQLALCMAAVWQTQLRVTFDAVLLCGDVGTFTDPSQLDSTTRRHAKANPCELEFLRQWSANPQPDWLAKIFAALEDEGLGLNCPVVMVHGNHEGFGHLESLVRCEMPRSAVPIPDLPGVDTAGWIRYLPSGWRCVTEAGLVIGGLGGIERGQRQAQYHELAYLEETAILHLIENGPVDVLLTHQGPNVTQGSKGSQLLDCLLESEIARIWYHGHSILDDKIEQAGPNAKTTIVPLHDVAFPVKGPNTEDPGDLGWCWTAFADELIVRRERPDCWRDYRKRKWSVLANGQLVCPPLTPLTRGV